MLRVQAAASSGPLFPARPLLVPIRHLRQRLPRHCLPSRFFCVRLRLPRSFSDGAAAPAALAAPGGDRLHAVGAVAVFGPACVIAVLLQRTQHARRSRACVAAAALEFGLAGVACEEELVAIDVGAVQVRQRGLRRAAQLAGSRRPELPGLLAGSEVPRQHIAAVEHKEGSVPEVAALGAQVVRDAALERVQVGEALLAQRGRVDVAADAAGTVHHHGRISGHARQVRRLRVHGRLPKLLLHRTLRALKMPRVPLVRVTHVQHHCAGHPLQAAASAAEHGLPVAGAELGGARRGVGDGQVRVATAQGHQVGLRLEAEGREGVPGRGVRGEGQPLKAAPCGEPLRVAHRRRPAAAVLRVDALRRDVDAAAQLGAAGLQERAVLRQLSLRIS
mmetsp:Transcript_3849/g.9610  ORF Transcript_3849/g.9610 Transcript_3849/m.9610 type:complete len:390 (-) Transcript_3849:63-1232(-)